MPKRRNIHGCVHDCCPLSVPGSDEKLQETYIVAPHLYHLGKADQTKHRQKYPKVLKYWDT